VAVARNGDKIVFGNTNDVYGSTYTYTRAEWDAFIAGVKRGDFIIGMGLEESAALLHRRADAIGAGQLPPAALS